MPGVEERVACISCSARSIFAFDEAMAIMHSAQALLLELPGEHLFSIDEAWRLVRTDNWQGQRLFEVVTGLMTSLRTAHDFRSSVI